jgi:hypothetical protein
MNAAELRAKIESYTEHLRQSEGKGVMFSETGPANMGLIQAIAEILESHEREIAQLKQQLKR